jgi:hypothetical protein
MSKTVCNCLVCGGDDADATCINQLDAFPQDADDLTIPAFLTKSDAATSDKGKAEYASGTSDFEELKKQVGEIEQQRRHLDEQMNALVSQANLTADQAREIAALRGDTAGKVVA